MKITITHQDIIRTLRRGTFLPCLVMLIFVFCEDGMRQAVEKENDLGRGDPYADYPVPGGYSILAVEDRAFTAVEVSWEPASDTASAPELLEYRVYRSPVNNLRTVGEIDENIASVTLVRDWTPALGSVRAAGLAAGTRYYFNVTVRDQEGNRSSYMPTRSTTLPANMVFLFSAEPVSGDLVSEFVDPSPATPRERADSLCRVTKANDYSELPCADANVRAFISIAEDDEIADMPANYGMDTGRPVRGPSGKKADQVAEHWDDLFDSDELALTLAKAGVTSGSWWSGSNAAGHYDATDNCAGWTSVASASRGRTGKKNMTDAEWIMSANPRCNTTQRILCACW